MAGVLPYMFSTSVGKSDCSYTLSEAWYFYELEKLWKFGVPNPVFQDTCIFTPLSKSAHQMLGSGNYCHEQE